MGYRIVNSTYGYIRTKVTAGRRFRTDLSVRKSERVNELDDETKCIIQLRTSVTLNEGTICLHHKEIYHTQYIKRQKACCDPKSVHKRCITKRLKTLHKEDTSLLDEHCGLTLTPGQKLCYRCFEVLTAPSVATENEDTTIIDSDSKFTVPHTEEQLNTSLTGLGVSPIKSARISEQNKKVYGKKKVKQIEHATTSMLSTVLHVDPSTLSSDQAASLCAKCTDMDILMQQLDEKIRTASRQRQIQLLTLAPQSWTIPQTMARFNVTRYKVRRSLQLKKTHGILAECPAKVGKTLHAEVEMRVKSFYEDDSFEVSRSLPGAKDYKSVKDASGKRVHKQKSLLLMNLNELYEKYKSKYPDDKIGLSKFCSLRPPQCITVGCRGTHSVCVCTIHQNTKLMISALPIGTPVTYRDLMSKLVCSLDAKLCMMHRCASCPNKDSLVSHLEDLCDVDSSADEEIRFKQWVSTDRTTLHDCCMPVSDFIETLADKCDKLTTHHFVSKHQSAYLSSLKESISTDEAIIILDFAENYSFIVQDAAQGFHWDNSQATLHPFVAYYKSPESNTQHTCMCVISDCLRHDTITVHCFLNPILKHMKEICPTLKKVYYFSDGAASQYKNCKNFSNLVFREDDFGLKAEWNFFATSHGKNACDGVGGTVKREAAKASLKAITTGHILTPMDLFQWAVLKIKNVDFYYISKEEVADHSSRQNERFSNIKTVQGTRDYHSFIPSDNRRLLAKRISGDESSVAVSVFVTEPPTERDIGASQLSWSLCEPGKYVACLYDGNWWIGMIRETSEEHADVLLSFLHPHGLAVSYRWPAREDLCWVPSQHLLRYIDAPTTSSGRQYHLSSKDRAVLATY